jgi:hypothetical protein
MPSHLIYCNVWLGPKLKMIQYTFGFENKQKKEKKTTSLNMQAS